MKKYQISYEDGSNRIQAVIFLINCWKLEKKLLKLGIDLEMEFYLVIQAIFHKLGKFSVSRYLHSEIDLIPKMKKIIYWSHTKAEIWSFTYGLWFKYIDKSQ